MYVCDNFIPLIYSVREINKLKVIVSNIEHISFKPEDPAAEICKKSYKVDITVYDLITAGNTQQNVSVDFYYS